MEKFLQMCKKFDLILLSVVVLVGKLVLVGGNISDAVAIVGLSAYLAVQLYINVKRDNLLDKANQQILAMSKEFQMLKQEVHTLKIKANTEISTKVLGNGQKTAQKDKRFF